MKLTSPAFSEGGKIPTKYTCEGEGVNPPLHIEEVPNHAKSLVLIMDDPDVPTFIRQDQMYDHWILFNLPPTLRWIEENTMPQGLAGKSTNGKPEYVGPCPPDREHRYFFKLYALDQELHLKKGATKKEVEEAMHGHIIEHTHLMARYKKHE
jgi:Raf kinase inhibitor-like YbhB/YbcL family protein